MPIFLRRQTPPPEESNYTKYRPFVREDFHECCAYCLLHEIIAGGEANFELDHFRPKAHTEFTRLANDFYNLYYSCHVCNQYKSRRWPNNALSENDYRFIDFCNENFSDHFREESDGSWTPLTKAGEYTEAKLRLNRKHLMKIRSLLRQLAALRGFKSMNWDTPCRNVVLQLLTHPPNT